MAYWHLITTEPHREAVAETSLRRIGWDTYVPRHRRLVPVQRRRADQRQQRRWVWRPCFPGYAFIRGGGSMYYLGDLEGCFGVVRFGDAAAAVNDNVVLELQIAEHAGVFDRLRPVLPFVVGQAVMVSMPAGVSLPAIVRALDSAKNVASVLLDFFGRATPLELPWSAIRASPPR